MRSTIVSYIENSNLPKADLWIAEAQFGFRYVKEKIEALNSGSNILEIGCGSGILLSMLSESFPNNSFEGIEPFGVGFSSLKELNALVKARGVKITNCLYEDFKSNKKYDLIYCVNVFEHVNDWEHALEWASEMLNEGGVFFILCPNYTFPYEPHFKIPVFINKKITYGMRKNYIDTFEDEHDCSGLWESINFVTKRGVKKFITENQTSLRLEMTDEIDILDDMVARVLDDAEFRKRQGVIGNIALFMNKIGIFNAVKLFPNLLPYMKVSFTKQSNASG